MKPADVPVGPLVIDTDVLSLVVLSRGRYREFESLIDGHVLTVAFATVAEIRAFALIAKWGEQRQRVLEERLHQLVVLPATDEVTRLFARIHARFRDQLKGGGVNDMWIASCALAQNPQPLPIVTGNVSDFQTIGREFALEIVHPDL
jgi:predicted nucleic acid-binding protein